MVTVSGQDLEIQYEFLYGVSSEAAVGNCIFRGSWLPWGGRGEGKCLTLGAEQSHITVRPALTVKSRR